MHASVKLVIACGAFAAVLPLLAMQDPQGAQSSQISRSDPFHQESTWSFTVLQYTNARGDVVEVPARNLSKIWLLKDEDGDLRMEILYQNRDYSSLAIRDFSVIRSSPSAVAVDVPIVRTTISGMAFPEMK
ncbi:MAG: hypothetical protein IT457_06465 [Planctomycetes bacterium]|jgi:hypothetical protein|nr:hypothetical protein [Planctomycetota bacterium]